MFDEIAGIFDGRILDLTFGTGPAPSSIRLTNFEFFVFGPNAGDPVTLDVVLTRVEVVPLPATALLLLGGLGALGLMGRRRAAA